MPPLDEQPRALFGVVLIDGLKLFRHLLRTACANELNCRVLGEAGTVAEANQVIAAAQPDLVILEANLPDGSGLEVYESLRQRSPEIQVVILSATCDDYTFLLLERAGIRAFVDKTNQTTEDLRAAIHAVREGGVYYSQSFLDCRRRRAANPNSFNKLLSRRESEVACLLTQSFSNKEIAERLGIAFHTVSTHRRRVMSKLGTNNIVGLMKRAIEQGLVRVSGQSGKTTLTSQHPFTRPR